MFVTHRERSILPKSKIYNNESPWLYFYLKVNVKYYYFYLPTYLKINFQLGPRGHLPPKFGKEGDWEIFVSLKARTEILGKELEGSMEFLCYLVHGLDLDYKNLKVGSVIFVDYLTWWHFSYRRSRESLMIVQSRGPVLWSTRCELLVGQRLGWSLVLSHKRESRK